MEPLKKRAVVADEEPRRQKSVKFTSIASTTSSSSGICASVDPSSEKIQSDKRLKVKLCSQQRREREKLIYQDLLYTRSCLETANNKLRQENDWMEVVLEGSRSAIEKHESSLDSHEIEAEAFGSPVIGNLYRDLSTAPSPTPTPSPDPSRYGEFMNQSVGSLNVPTIVNANALPAPTDSVPVSRMLPASFEALMRLRPDIGTSTSDLVVKHAGLAALQQTPSDQVLCRPYDGEEDQTSSLMLLRKRYREKEKDAAWARLAKDIELCVTRDQLLTQSASTDSQQFYFQSEPQRNFAQNARAREGSVESSARDYALLQYSYQIRFLRTYTHLLVRWKN